MNLRGLLAGCCLMLAAVPASAQSAVSGRGYLSFGRVFLSASETFDAVAGQHDAPSLGIGGSLTGLWRGLFVDVAFSQQTLDGQRVFVAGGEVFPLNIPLRITFRPFDVAGGWRVTRTYYSPYVGVGFTRIGYEETSDFSKVDEDVNAGRYGLLLIGGIDVPVWRWLHVGGEVRYRRVNGLLGEAGVSAVFNEDQLGGVSTAVRISLVR